MAIIFYVIGWIAIGVGALWTATAFMANGPVGQGEGAQGIVVLARVLVATPGLGTMFSGLLILAVGGVLSRLDAIERNTRGAAALAAPGHRIEPRT